MTAQPSTTDSTEDVDEIIPLKNAAMQVQIERRGGQFVDIQLTEIPLNPLSWRSTPKAMPKLAHKDAVYKGHFLCIGRAGNPSPGEIKAGVPMRGEQTGRLWTITEQTDRVVRMECAAPLDGLNVERRVELDASNSVFFVTEWFENTSPLGRLNNILQHVTIGPPFLSNRTLINSNAKQGFNHKFSYPDPHKFEFDFPHAQLDKKSTHATDIRLTSDTSNYLTTHIFSSDETYGWVTAYDPVSGLVLGYVWKVDAYPWINFWNKATNGIPLAKGLEFGTTGVEGTYRQLLENNARFHGIPSWEYIDAGERIEKSYLAFLIHIGAEQENPFLTIQDNRLLLNGRIEIRNPFTEQQ